MYICRHCARAHHSTQQAVSATVQQQEPFKHPKDMANRKTLKKHINFVCSELFAECVALRHYKLTSATQDLDNVMRRILLMHSDFIARISHTEPGNARYFYKRLKEDFRLQTDEIINAISQIC